MSGGGTGLMSGGGESMTSGTPVGGEGGCSIMSSIRCNICAPAVWYAM